MLIITFNELDGKTQVSPTLATPCPTQVSEEDVRKAYQRAMDSMARLNRTASRYIHREMDLKNTFTQQYPG